MLQCDDLLQRVIHEISPRRVGAGYLSSEFHHLLFDTTNVALERTRTQGDTRNNYCTKAPQFLGRTNVLPPPIILNSARRFRAQAASV